jgi:hypothetical protein
MAFFTVVQLSRWPRISPFFHLAQFSPVALHPIPKAGPTPFWENFLRDLTHPAGCSSFYTVLLFVRAVVSFIYSGLLFPEGVSRRYRSQSPPFWENFLRALTHPADCPSFYTLLLFVRVFAGLVYGGPDCPGCRTAFFYLWLLFTIGIELVLPAPVR